jgi:hypothetical protein
MQLHESLRRLLIGTAVAASVWTVVATATPDRTDIDAVVTHVGERVGAYYRRAQQLVCVERSTVLPVGRDWGADGFARTVESDLRVEMDGADTGEMPDARVTREIRRINGRAPRERDLKDRSGCTDPTPLSPEPVAFLLPRYRTDYNFTAIHEGKDRDRAALVIDFSSVRRRGNPELIQDEYGHDDCFDWKGPLAIAGRVWVDAATHDVLRVERRVAGPTDVRVPLPLQRKYLFTPWLTLDRDDLTLRYKAVTFTDPDEVVLLPETIDSLTVFRNGLQSIRRTQTFSDYRRFLTAGRLKGR